MRTIDPGHRYELAVLDGPGQSATLQFVKRVGPGYPGNVCPSRPGTTVQEVARALLERCRYLNGQISCVETEAAISLLRVLLTLFEMRAKRVKGKYLQAAALDEIEFADICPHCAHVQCAEDHEAK